MLLNKSIRTIWRYDPDVTGSTVDEIVDAIVKEYNEQSPTPSSIEIIINVHGLAVASILALNGLSVKKMKKTLRGIVEVGDGTATINNVTAQKLKDIISMNFWHRLRALFFGIKL